MTPLSEKKLFLFDIDGTIAVGDILLPGSRELLSYIRSVGGAAYYITNNSTKSGADYVRRFRDVFRLETTEDLFITSGYMTLRFLQRHYPTQTVFVMGTASFVSELKKQGLHVTETWQENIACAVAAYDSELTYQKLVEICRVLSTLEVPFYATNPDLCCPFDFGFIPDCGSICQMITASTGKTPLYLGKPSREIVDLCLERSGFSPSQTLVVGDRLYTDIACGINGEVDTCLVYTGEATPQEAADTPYPPSCAFESVRELLDACRGIRS